MSYKQIKDILRNILFLNLFVAIIKIIFGILSGALSVLSDGLHSLFDGISNIIGLIGIKLASKHKDSDHPYGHKKYEHFASIFIVFLLLYTSIELLKKIIERIQNPITTKINQTLFIVMIITLIINFFVYRYENKKGHELKSTILIADSNHTKSDVFVTISVIIGLIATKLGYPIIDIIIAGIILILILKMAFEILKEVSQPLLDKAMIDKTKIIKISKKNKDIINVHKIRSRGNENFIFLDMHIIVDKNLSIEKAHKISHQLKGKIMKEIKQIKDVVIHVEPN